MTAGLKLLFIDDSPVDTELEEVHELQAAGLEFEWTRVSDFAGLERKLERGGWDAVISDVGLPGLSLGVALSLIRRYDIDLPVLIVSDMIGDATALAAMKAGAQDYVIKSEGLARLAPAIEREVDDARYRRMLRQEKELRRNSERENRRLAAIVESSAEAIISISPHGRVESWNRGAETVFGFSETEMIGRPCSRLMSTGARAGFQSVLNRMVEGDSIEQQDAAWRRRDGRTIYVSVTTSPIYADDGAVTGGSIIVRDITYRRETELKLRHLADHDILTNLFNRRRFERELRREIKLIGRFDLRGAVLAVGIDNLKSINDGLGHQAGDQVIIRVARILRENLRDVDVFARTGGDEFAIYTPETDAEEVASRLVDAVSTAEVVFGGRTIRVSVSIGITLATDSSISNGELITQAEIAMSQAKESGHSKYSLYRADPGYFLRAAEGLKMADRLRSALAEGHLAVYAQPILDRRRNRISQYELLVRMNGSNGLPILPDSFLPTADRSGLIADIDRWMLSEAIAMLADPALLDPESSLQVNLSSRSMVDPGLRDLIEGEFNSHGGDPWRLILEVTETNVIDNMEDARLLAISLSALGCRFALDDFGAGFGSFSYLKHLPFDFLKIDGSFIRNLSVSRTDQHMVESIIDLSHRLGKLTIAECVENSETIDLLSNYGVDYIQGFQIGEPRPAADLNLPPPGRIGQTV